MKRISIENRPFHAVSKWVIICCLLKNSMIAFGIKLSPVQKQIQRVDIGIECQLLVAAFKDAYALVHVERLKAISSDAVMETTEYLPTIHRLKISIDRWTVLAGKLQNSSTPETVLHFKQVNSCLFPVVFIMFNLNDMNIVIK
jgi:hypothetical protein